MKRDLINEVYNSSLAGKIKFPDIVKTLLDAGIEAYHVDLVRGEYRYYDSQGESHIISHKHDLPLAAEDFSASGVIHGIKQSQQGLIDYKSFLKEINRAGCVYYVAYLKGKRVIYFGRNGDLHVEHFPQ